MASIERDMLHIIQRGEKSRRQEVGGGRERGR